MGSDVGGLCSLGIDVGSAGEQSARGQFAQLCMHEPGLAGAVWITGGPESDGGSGLASSARPGPAL
eukprot:1895178-Lingulodinium_polyedra.AAC.1